MSLQQTYEMNTFITSISTNEETSSEKLGNLIKITHRAGHKTRT